jgi:sec-independent protein translocase protein TatA
MPGFGLIQPLHLLLILVIVMVIFGAGKLGQVGAALGQSVREFKETVKEDEDEGVGEEAAAPAPPPLAQVTPEQGLPAAAPSVQLAQREEI